MQTIYTIFAIFLLLLMSLGFSTVAWADMSGTATLKGATSLNFDTGATSSSATGSDILWNGAVFSLRGTASVYNYGTSGAAGTTLFASLTSQQLQAIPAAQFSKAEVTAAQMPVGDVFVVHTNAGSYAKVLVTADAGGSLTLQYQTYSVVAGPSAPKITFIENAATNNPNALPNGGIAQGALFVVKGTSLGPASLALATAFPLTTSIGGTSVSVTVNGTTVSAIMYYSLAGQIAAILPSKTPVGTGTLTVSYNGQTSATAPITVVASNIGMFTLNSSGSGDVVATLPADNTVVSPSNAPSPGDTVTLWATGLGPVSFDETNPAQQADMTSVPLKVYIGGQPANVLFRGRNACCSAVDTIYVTVPSGLRGCANSVIMQIGNLVSNAASIPIGTSGRNCVPLNPNQNLSGLNGTGGETRAFGGLALVRQVELFTLGTTIESNIKMDIIGGTFEKVTYTGSTPPQGSDLDTNSYGSCTVRVSTAGQPQPPVQTSVQGLDAGQITVAGPGIAGTRTLTKSTAGGLLIYGLQLDSTATTLAAGTYTFTGGGGPDVGAFTATYNSPTPLAWTNQSSLGTINRANGATVTWSGGDPTGYVTIAGASTYYGATAANNATVSFTCVARVSDGSFFIPPVVLLSVPPSTARTGTTIEPGTLTVSSFAPTVTTFQASGIDVGGIGSTSVYGGSAIYQ
jgi:uncharacterized protein (TIGR03437 family)